MEPWDLSSVPWGVGYSAVLLPEAAIPPSLTPFIFGSIQAESQVYIFSLSNTMDLHRIFTGVSFPHHILYTQEFLLAASCVAY